MFIKRCKSSVKSGFIDGSYWGYKVLLENNQGFIKYTEFITKKKGRGRFKPLNLCSQSQFLIYMSFCIQNNKNQLELALNIISCLAYLLLFGQIMIPGRWMGPQWEFKVLYRNIFLKILKNVPVPIRQKTCVEAFPGSVD